MFKWVQISLGSEDDRGRGVATNDFWHKRKIYNFEPYNVLFAIATNATYD